MSENVHVLQVAKSAGGVGVYMRRLVEALDKERYKVTAVCLGDGSEEMASHLSKLPGVTAMNIPMKDYMEPISDFGVYTRIAGIIRSSRPDLIHAHTSKPGFFTRLAAFGTHIPVIYRPANFAFHEGTSKPTAWVYATIERVMALYFTERIVAVCEGEREFARSFSVGTDTQFVVIYTGVDLDRFKVSVNRDAIRSELGVPVGVRLAGTVARLTEAKAPGDFIRAAAIVHSQDPSAHFLWVGSGPLEDEARALVQSLGMGDIFHFVGHRDDIPLVLKALDCFVLSSHWEGFSIAILEAMAAGLPIVSTKVMGAAEAICDHETGFLVPIGDVQALAASIERLLIDAPLSHKIGMAAQKRAKTMFSHAVMISRIDSLYQEVYRKYNP